MMALLGGVVVVVGFVLLIQLGGLVRKSAQVIALTKAALIVVRDAGIDDAQKEIALQGYAVALFVLFFQITVLSVVAIALPFLIIWLMEIAQLVTVNEVVDTMFSITFTLFAAAFSGLLLLLPYPKSSKP